MIRKGQLATDTRDAKSFAGQFYALAERSVQIQWHGHEDEY